MAETIAFYFFAGLAILASAAVIGQRNPMYSVLMLVASFGAMAALFIQLDAPFVAVALMIVYAGAIMVLFLFVVMLLNAPAEDALQYDRTHIFRHPLLTRFGVLLAVLLVVQLAYALLRETALHVPVSGRSDASVVSSVSELGRVLFERHGFAFEATSILILVAMVGAVVLARKEVEP